MTFVGDLFQKTWKDGSSEDDLLRRMQYELSVTISSSQTQNKGKSREEIEKGKLAPLLKGLNDKSITPKVSEVMNSIYNARRLANYPESQRDVSLLRIEQLRSDQMDLINENKWCFRFPKNRKEKGWSSSQKSVERLIVNAESNKDIIKILDEFSAKYDCGYKTPEAEDFSSRVDTVVLYAYKPLSDEAKKEFVSLMSPYVRKSLPERTNDLDGQQLSSGIFSAKELSAGEFDSFFKGIKDSVSKSLYDEIAQYIGNDRLKNRKMSLGERTIIEQFSQLYNDKFGTNTKDLSKSKSSKDVLAHYDLSFEKETKKVFFMPKKGADELEGYKVLKQNFPDLELSGERLHNGKPTRLFCLDAPTSNDSKLSKVINEYIANKKKSEGNGQRQ